MDVLQQLIEGYLRDVSKNVAAQALAQHGQKILGAVPGRSLAEDEEIELDRLCDDLLDVHIKRSKLSIEVHSEHGVRRVGKNIPEYLITIDPFDGSGLFRRGIPAEWWSVFTVFAYGSIRPITGGAVDVLRREYYIADKTNVTLVSLDTGERTVLPKPIRKASLNNNTILAAYLMDPAYLLDWTSLGKGLLTRLVSKNRAVRIWPNGGSCIYPWLARGLVHAYIMFDEPRSEIDSGLAFVQAAGLVLVEVQADGGIVPYEFKVGETEGRVRCFIAAVSKALAKDIAQIICEQ